MTVFVSREFAMGPFHELGGWAIIMGMFGLCWWIFSMQTMDTHSNGVNLK